MNSVYRTSNNDFIDLDQIVCVHLPHDQDWNSGHSTTRIDITCKYNKDVTLFIERFDPCFERDLTFTNKFRDDLVKAWIQYKNGYYFSNAEIKPDEIQN